MQQSDRTIKLNGPDKIAQAKQSFDAIAAGSGKLVFNSSGPNETAWYHMHEKKIALSGKNVGTTIDPTRHGTSAVDAASCTVGVGVVGAHDEEVASCQMETSMRGNTINTQKLRRRKLASAQGTSFPDGRQGRILRLCRHTEVPKRLTAGGKSGKPADHQTQTKPCRECLETSRAYDTTLFRRRRCLRYTCTRHHTKHEYINNARATKALEGEKKPDTKKTS